MKKNNKKKIVIGAVAAGLTIMTSSVGVWAYTTPVSYVSLDVNPSIEYTLNAFDRVIEVEAVNEDGQTILANVEDLNNLKIEEAITETVEQLTQEGYLQAANSTAAETLNTGAAATQVATTESTADSNAVGTTVTENTTVDNTATVGTTVVTTADTTETTATQGTTATDNTATNQAENTAAATSTDITGGIIITVSNNNGNVSEELTEKLQDAIENIVSENVEVEVTKIGYERVLRARELGVSPGKLNLVEKLIASSETPDSIVISEWVNKPVKTIMKAIKANKAATNENVENQDGDDQDAVTTDGNQAVVITTDATTVVTGNNTPVDTEDANEDASDDDDKEDKVTKEMKEQAKEAAAQAREAKKEAEKAAREAKKEAAEAARETEKDSEEKAREAAKELNEKAKEAEEQAREAAQELKEKEREEQKEAAEKAREASKAFEKNNKKSLSDED